MDECVRSHANWIPEICSNAHNKESQTVCIFTSLSQRKMFHFQFQMCVHLSIYLFRVVLLTMPGSFLLGTLASLAGLCIFAHFTNIGCDPLADGKISNPNQVDSLHFY